MPCTVGEQAPPFVLPASTGQDISLQALAGKTVVLYFYPRDDTPGCTTEAYGFRNTYAALKAADVEVLGVSADSLRAHTTKDMPPRYWQRCGPGQGHRQRSRPMGRERACTA